MHLILPTVNRQTEMFHFSYKSMFPTLTRQILQKVNVINICTHYMLVGSWVKVGNILSYEKQNNEASPFVYLW